MEKREKLKTLDRVSINFNLIFMKKSNVNLNHLLDQLSEEKINLVVDSGLFRAGGGECGTTTGKSKSSTHSDSTSACGDCGGGTSGGGGIIIGIGGGGILGGGLGGIC